MSHVRLLGPKRYQARWTDPAGVQRSKTFIKKSDAEKHITAMDHAKLSGTYVDPTASRLTVSSVAEQWIAGKVNSKATTLARSRSILDVHVLPRWGTISVGRVEHSAVQAWIVELMARGLAPATVKKVHGALFGILGLAVRDRRLSSNPCAGVNLPRTVPKRRRYLTAQQVAELAIEASTPTGKSRGRRTAETFEQNQLIVYVLAYCGLRWGELAALRPSSVDLVRRRLQITSSVTDVDRRGLTWTSPKDHEARSVGVPAFLINALALHMAGRDREDLLFPSPSGGPLSHRAERRAWFSRAAENIGAAGLTPHDLRHTAASLAVSVGANVKAVQRMLGHASAAMTLDTYADLFDEDLDGVAERLDVLATRHLEQLSESAMNPALIPMPRTRHGSPASRANAGL